MINQENEPTVEEPRTYQLYMNPKTVKELSYWEYLYKLNRQQRRDFERRNKKENLETRLKKLKERA